MGCPYNATNNMKNGHHRLLWYPHAEWLQRLTKLKPPVIKIYKEDHQKKEVDCVQNILW